MVKKEDMEAAARLGEQLIRREMFRRSLEARENRLLPLAPKRAY